MPYHAGIQAFTARRLAFAYHCTSGFYTYGGNDESRRDSITQSPPGTFASRGYAIVCGTGRYGTKWGETSSSCTGACPAGYFCPFGTTVPFPCGAPHLFCPEGSSNPRKVHRGYYTIGGDVNGTTRIAEIKTEMSPTLLMEYATCPAGRYGGAIGLYNESCSGNCSAGCCPPPSRLDTERECSSPMSTALLVRHFPTVSAGYYTRRNVSAPHFLDPLS